MRVVLPDLAEVPWEELQGHKQSCQQTCKEIQWGRRQNDAPCKLHTHHLSSSKRKGQLRETPWNHRGSRSLWAIHFTLAFVIDLPGGNDFVEDSSKRLILSYDSRGDEWRHDELPLTDVGFHGYPGREVSGWERSAASIVDRRQTNGQESCKSNERLSRSLDKMDHYPSQTLLTSGHYTGVKSQSTCTWKHKTTYMYITNCTF